MDQDKGKKKVNRCEMNENPSHDSLADSARKEKLARSISLFEKRTKGGRAALILLAVFSLVNMILLLVKASFMFLFTFEIPYFAVELCQYLSYETGNQTYLVISVIGSLLFIGFIFLLYLLSQKRRWPGIMALVLFIIDTLALIAFILIDLENAAQYLVDTAFHVWALISLINLVRYWPKLEKAKTEYDSLYPAGPQNTAKPVTIQFFEFNSNTIREIRGMDHNGTEYKKALRSVRLSLGEAFPRRKNYLDNDVDEKHFRRQISRHRSGVIVSIIFMFVFILIAALFLPDEVAQFDTLEIVGFCSFLIAEIAAFIFLFLYLRKYSHTINQYFSYIVDHYELDEG
jgi:hypothetical protein